MVQTQGRYGIDKRKIWTWYGHKEDLYGLLLDTFWHSYCITLNFILSQHYIYVYICILTNVYKKTFKQNVWQELQNFLLASGVILNFFYL